MTDDYYKRQSSIYTVIPTTFKSVKHALVYFVSLVCQFSVAGLSISITIIYLL